MPAALVDDGGTAIAVNRWIDAEVGRPLVRPADETAPGLAFGVDETSRWRLRPLDEQASVLLATGEREDAGDHLLRKFFSSGDSLFVVYDQAGRVIESNAAWENLLGYRRDDVFGLDSWTLLPPEDIETRPQVEADLRRSGRSEPTFKLRTADGSYRDIRWALHFDTAVGRCFGIGRDVTEEGKQTAELERRAFTDELTSLHNRAYLVEQLASLTSGSTTPAVLFCDLDHFKVVNDSLGHQAGDELLASLSRRLLAVAEPHDAVVARFGGDEFVLLLGDAHRAQACSVAEQVQAALRRPFHIVGRPIHVGMSIGIAVTPTPGARSADELLGEADTAAYRAKSLGRGRSVVFDEALRAAADRRFDVEEGLRDAIDTDHLEVHYQPIVALPGGGVIGAEALVRWRHPDGRLIGPGGFLDIAEEAGLLPEIGRIVATDAFDLGAELARRGRELVISVNVSGQDLADPTFVRRTTELLGDAGLAPEQVLMEITESAVHDTEASLPALQDLRSTGVRVGLDDFGTGYSSLAHLRQLPIDVVKVDRSFVADLVDDAVTRAVTRSLVDLCAALGLGMVLEGIETKDQASAVEQIGGTMAQGFLFHRPMPRTDLEQLLDPHDADPPPARRQAVLRR